MILNHRCLSSEKNKKKYFLKSCWILIHSYLSYEKKIKKKLILNINGKTCTSKPIGHTIFNKCKGVHTQS